MQIFPKWTNKLPLAIAVGATVGLCAVVGLVWYYFSPWFTDVGYAPVQPVAYSHKLHAGTLGIDCLYCHGNAEKGAHANIPATQVCMNCHRLVKTDSPKLAKVRESFATGMPIEWERIHKVPDFAFFNHSAHLNAGVGCVECHGRIDQMERVAQQKPLSMSWCLECHRDPQPHLRPKELVTAMDWKPSDTDPKTILSALAPNQAASGQHGSTQNTKSVSPPVHCSGCHR